MQFPETVRNWRTIGLACATEGDNVEGNKVQIAKQIEQMGFDSPHDTNSCSQNTKIIDYIKDDPYSNAYNPGWRNHLTLGGEKVVNSIIDWPTSMVDVVRHLVITKTIKTPGRITLINKIRIPQPLRPLLWKTT
ncbi:hypothetical protein E5676_scaffold236G00440 [Cucumis melo var. makuwa]|uniref:Uncharacterized protein n=1 Tax=Cucumis melo var. makuwa TaxID=1194695 RepID=A0A5A7U4Q3_CUCMM|nr:hypothetical protein E6C27_scaffold61G002530 [Cucumis melo var. makuwa]TYK27189.1 hypothetical protein E5676_scaffold236G00440 [Cucumis melo var. makuwa]